MVSDWLKRAFYCFMAVGALAHPFAGAAGAPVGDPKGGKVMYEDCAGCHSMRNDLLGPKHCGLMGRRAGTMPGFAYSDAMRESGIVWTVKTLDGYLKSPETYLPGTNMQYYGIENDADRADLIAYLQIASKDPAVCGTKKAPNAAAK